SPLDGASGDFDEAVGELVRALETDIAWIREHTRLGALAERWETRKRPGDLLLRGAELNAAETWLTTRPETAPDPTDAQRALIAPSRQAATRRQRTLVATSLATVAAASTLAGIALWQRAIALEHEARAVKSEAQAIRSEAQIRKVSEQAQYTESGLLADTASQITDNELGNDSGTAVLVTIEGLPDHASDDQARRARRHAGEAEFQLDRSIRNLHERSVLAGHTETVTVAAWSPNGARILTASSSDVAANIVSISKDWTVRVSDPTSGKEVARLEGHVDMVTSAAWSPDGARIVTASQDKTARIWDAAMGKELTRLDGHGSWVTSAAWSPDGRRIVTASMDGTARIWDAATGKELTR